MSARNHEVTAKQQLNSSEGDIVYEKKNLRLKYVLEKILKIYQKEVQ